MNANKLFKLLKRSEDSYNRLEEYKKILDQAERIVIDFTNFKSFDVFTEKSMSSIKNSGLSLPFDNVLLDITGVEIANIVNGSIQKNDLLLHIIPIEVATDISTFRIMLIQDMRFLNGDIYPRSHIVSLEEEILSMPVIDDGMASLGCKCYKNNPLSYGLLFKQIQSFTPDFKADIGFAIRNCVSNIPMCRKLLDESAAITKIAIASIVYLNRPDHKVVTVNDLSDSKSKQHQIICDNNSWQTLGETGKTSELSFNDGNNFDIPTQPTNVAGTITRGKVVYRALEQQ